MIFIVGVPRSGKSTLAKKLKEVYPNSNIISCEAIQKSVNSMGLGSENLSCKGDSLIKFVSKIAEWNEILTSQKSIIDAGGVTIENVFANLRPRDRIICLGFGGNSTKEEIWSSIQAHQQEFDETVGLNLERATHYWGDFGRRDKNNRYFCVDNNLVYLDTKDEQQKVLDYIVGLLHGDFE